MLLNINQTGYYTTCNILLLNIDQTHISTFNRTWLLRSQELIIVNNKIFIFFVNKLG